MILSGALVIYMYVNKLLALTTDRGRSSLGAGGGGCGKHLWHEPSSGVRGHAPQENLNF